MISKYVPKDFAKLLNEYVTLVDKIVKGLRNSIKLLNEMRVGEALEQISECIKNDTKADNIRRKILYEISNYVEDVDIRESIVRLIRRFDLVAEWSKEASRYLSIIPYLEIPADVREKIKKLSEYAVESVDTLVDAVESLLEGDVEVAREHACRVEELEERADEVNVAARKLLLNYGSGIKNPAFIIMLKDFIESLENVVDYAEDAADYVRALAIRFK